MLESETSDGALVVRCAEDRFTEIAMIFTGQAGVGHAIVSALDRIAQAVAGLGSVGAGPRDYVIVESASQIADAIESAGRRSSGGGL